MRGVDYNWRNQRVDQGSFNVERQIRRNMLMDVGYMHVRGRNNNHGRNINQAPPGPANVDFNLRRPLHAQYPNLGDIPFSFPKAGSYYDAADRAVHGQRVTKYCNVYATYAHGRNFSNGNNINPADISSITDRRSRTSRTSSTRRSTSRSPVGRGKAATAPASRLAGCGDRRLALLRDSFSSAAVRVSASLRPVSLLHNGQATGRTAWRTAIFRRASGRLRRWFDTAAFVNHLRRSDLWERGHESVVCGRRAAARLFDLQNLPDSENELSLEFRADLFNTFNHPNFNPPTATSGQRVQRARDIDIHRSAPAAIRAAAILLIEGCVALALQTLAER